MKKIIAILAVPALLALVACGDDDGEAADARARQCEGPFEATVYSGPSKPLSVKGALTLNIEDSGSASGSLRQADGTVVKTAGQVDGRAISLAFDLGRRGTLYGTGAARDADVSECRGEMGGSLTGPRPGDSGDWGYAIGG